MAPAKFVAPLKRHGQNSFSSAFSSSSSIASVYQDVKPTSTKSEAQKQEESTPIPKRQKLVASEPIAKSKCSKQVLSKPPIPKPKVKKSSDRSVGPSQKKQKIEFPAVSSSATKGKVNNDDNKENANPKILRKAPSRPIVPLTDQEYELIFQSVLAKSKGSFSSTTESNTNTSTAQDEVDISADFLEFSQSDLDDSEGEQTAEAHASKKNFKAKKANDAKENTPTNNSSPDISPETTDLKEPCDNSILDDTSRSFHEFSVTPLKVDALKQITAGKAGDLCQEDLPAVQSLLEKGSTSAVHEILSHTEDTDEKSQVEAQASQVSSIGEFENVISSTPRADKKTNINSSLLITPQKTSHASKLLASSQEINVSPAISLGPKASIAASGGAMSAAVGTPRSSLSTSQTPLGPTNPAVTPIRPRPLGLTPQSSQELKTPLTTPIRSSQTSQSSRKPETPIRTPIKPSLSNSNFGSPAPSTPNGSQHLSQEIQHTPPPPESTARERLLWLQKKRLAGLWVQCDNRDCMKWRYLQDTHDPTTLSKRWYCRMHPDQEFNNCEAPEKRLNLHAEDDMIFNKYSPGSLVWAKLSGYPWWPAMVEDDPDLEQFYWLNLFSDIPTWYHVVFFDHDETGKSSCCRAWLQTERLKNLEDQIFDVHSAELVGHKKRIAAAYAKATNAQRLNIEDRLAEYSFATQYKRPIGGSVTEKFSGPIGQRKPSYN